MFFPRKHLFISIAIAAALLVVIVLAFGGSSEQREVRTLDPRVLDPIALEVPVYFQPIHAARAGEVIKGTLSDTAIEQGLPSVRFSVGSDWAEFSLDDSQFTYAQQRDEHTVVYEEVFPGVDAEYKLYDGFVKETLILKRADTPLSFTYTLTVSHDIEAGEVTGGFIPLYRKGTQEEVMMLRVPQGVDSENKRLDYTYTISDITTPESADNQYSVHIKPARPFQIPDLVYPVYVDPSIQTTAWDEALVKIGENCDDPACIKDGDVVAVKPAGWNWGTEERKKFLIIRIKKQATQDRIDLNGRTLTKADPAIPGEEERLASRRGVVRFGIDYTQLASPEELAVIRDPELINPVLDARENPAVIQKKSDVFASVIPDDRRLAYQPPPQPTFIQKVARAITPVAHAATTVTKTVGTSSRNYSTISLWVSGETGNLVSLDEVHKGEAYNDSGFDENVLIDLSTTDSTRYMWLTTANNSTDRHDGTASQGANLTAATGEPMVLDDSYTIFEWFVVKNWGSGSSEKVGVQAGTNDGIRIQYNVLDGGTSPHDTASGIQVTRDNEFVYNNIVMNLTGTTGGIAVAQDTNADNVIYYNNTVYNVRIGFGFLNSATDGDARNNIALTCSSACYSGTFHSNSNYNMASDTSAPGANSLQSKTAANNFTTTTSGSEDLHLKAGADAINVASDLSGTFTDDIDAETRPTGANTWDMGADERFGNATPSITSVTDSPDPVVVGNNVSFSVDWNDTDAGENIKVKICKTDVLASQNCSGGFWATSSSFTTSDPEAPTYTAQTADIASSPNDYYAYVCDDEGACVASGSGTYGTFSVNAALSISAVNDTPDPTNPGRSVTWFIDWAGGTGTTKAKVCKTNSLSSQVCGGGSWASSTAFTTNDPIQLYYDIVGGDAGQTRSYYVFVCDDGGTCTSSTSGTFSVNSVSTQENIKVRGGVELR